MLVIVFEERRSPHFIRWETRSREGDATVARCIVHLCGPLLQIQQATSHTPNGVFRQFEQCVVDVQPLDSNHI